MNDRTSDVTKELYISPSYSESSCIAYQRLQRFESKLERLDERSIQVRDEVRFIRRQTMEYMENSNRQHSVRKTYMDTKFADDCAENIGKLEMTKTNKGLMSDLKKSWTTCADSLKAIEEKETKRSAALDKLIEEENKKSR